MLNPTANPETEKALIGACVTSPEKLYKAAAIVRPDDFSSDSHRRIWTSLLDMATQDKPLDLLTLADELNQRKTFEAIGGWAFLSDLTTHAAVGSVEHHARLIVDRARRRQLAQACEAGRLATEDASESTTSCLAIVHEAVLEIEARTAEMAAASPTAEFMADTVAELREQAERDGLIGMPTGIPTLDQATGGIRDGELWIVGALPSRGKTALGVQMAMANAAAGIPAVLFSLEMSKKGIGRRMLAARSKVPSSRIRRPRYIAEHEWTALTLAQQEIEAWPLWVDESPSLKLRELIARARLYVRRHKVRLIVVDYLRLVEGRGKDLREQVSSVADGLRQFAKSENVGVVLLSQLRRPEGGINQEPTMLTLKESGDLEAHAHVVLLLYMPVNQETGEFTRQDKLLIGKQREGVTGPLPVRFSTERLLFEPREVSRGQQTGVEGVEAGPVD